MAMKTKVLTTQATPQDNAAQGGILRQQTATVAARNDILPATLLRMAKRGLLPMPIKLGKLYLWDVAAVEQALQELASQGGKNV